MPKHDPPIRDVGPALQIDQKKGAYPFVTFAVDGESDKLIIMIDANEGGTTIAQGQNVAFLKLSPKKAQAIRKWLDREFPE